MPVATAAGTNPSLVIAQRLVLDEKPTVLPVFQARAHLQLERDPPLHSLMAIISELLEVIGMKEPRAKVIGHHVLQAEAR